MAIKFNRSQTFATNGTVTAPGLHNLVDGLDIYQALITDQTNLTSVGTADELLIADADLTAADAPRAVTVQELFDDALTVGTYTNAQLTGNLTYGTATGNRTVSTSASITTGTINNATLGTTTGTAATFTNATATGANITTGTIQTLTSSTATITGGTFSGSINATAGTIGTLNSTTGTITNFSTTLAGDFTISQGTGTLATSGATAGTYGSVTEIPFLTVNAKGIITSATTGTFSSTPPANSVTFNTLSTSATESDNVANRVAKAWVNFDGTFASSPFTIANGGIRASFNVSSVTDNGTGQYTVNFAASLIDANYAVVGTSRGGDASDDSMEVVGVSFNTAPTTSAVRISVSHYTTFFDTPMVSVVIFR